MLGLEPNWASPPDGYALTAINLGVLTSYKPACAERIAIQLESSVWESWQKARPDPNTPYSVTPILRYFFDSSSFDLKINTRRRVHQMAANAP